MWEGCFYLEKQVKKKVVFEKDNVTDLESGE